MLPRLNFEKYVGMVVILTFNYFNERGMCPSAEEGAPLVPSPPGRTLPSSMYNNDCGVSAAGGARSQWPVVSGGGVACGGSPAGVGAGVG